eukprot:TRINITY_DN15459_c0_g1_i1.p1 TRINITY_DN15459_c0_g1~~TRINITY_DN15459_c0_g1_i1.p1  ORF type:complete len:108 (+),score=28.26 TRINITY_DN15459_c0_g1_i1:236-559(+)
MANDSKKEAFRKYLEASGVLDALTKVLVALYEENEKPTAAIEFIQRSLGGPTFAEYEELKTEKAELESKYEQLLVSHSETLSELKCLRNASAHQQNGEKEASSSRVS